jgi:spermidine/putrescine transport system substrate-binding protein
MTTNPTIDPRWARPFSRRAFLRGTGGALGLAAFGSVLAACAEDAAGAFDGPPTGRVDFANWPLYVDRKVEKGQVVRPSLREFTKQTSIEVNYREVIPDAETFYQEIQPYLAAGKPSGWDIAVITNGGTFTKMRQLGQMVALPTDKRPNFDANASDLAKDPVYDIGNQYSMPWQSGVTGIGWNPDLTGGHPVNTLEQLFSGDLPGKIGMFSDNVDMPNMLLLAVGIEPETSNEADWKHAAQWLHDKLDKGLRVTFFKQNYLNALAAGDVVASMAWSGDIYIENALGVPEGLQFVSPNDGALLWTDNMVIPLGAEHPVDAITMMDFVYKPEIAAMITEWVAYITPVPAAADVILADAGAASNPSTQKTLRALVDSPLVFLPPDQASSLHTYRELTTDEELNGWDEAFGRFMA